MPAETYRIAQVTPYPWEQHHEVNAYVERLSDELCGRGHRVVVVAPSESRALIKEGRARIREMRSDPGAAFADEGCASVLGVGQSLPFRRGGSVSLPLDVSRSIEEFMERAELDFVHVHEPFAPERRERGAAPFARAERGHLPLAHRAVRLDPGGAARWWSACSAASTGAPRRSPPPATSWSASSPAATG